MEQKLIPNLDKHNLRNFIFHLDMNIKTKHPNPVLSLRATNSSNCNNIYMRYWAGKVLRYTIIINQYNQGRFTIFEISFHYHNFWISEVDFTWDMRQWVSFSMILQLFTQVSWILWLRLRTGAWYARLARALVRSSVMNIAGSKARFSSYST